MSKLQQPTTAPQAPAAPAPHAPAAPSQADLQASIREQVLQSIQDARAAEKGARDAAQAAHQIPGTPVVLVPPRGRDFNFDQGQFQNMAQNISSYFFITVAVIAIGVPLARAFARRLGPAPVAPPLPKAVSDQLQRIEQAVESMAIEVERISEAQRYLTKLQTGQGQPAALPPRQGV